MVCFIHVLMLLGCTWKDAKEEEDQYQSKTVYWVNAMDCEIIWKNQKDLCWKRELRRILWWTKRERIENMIESMIEGNYDRRTKERNEINWKEKRLHGKFPKWVVDFVDSVSSQWLRSGYVKNLLSLPFCGWVINAHFKWLWTVRKAALFD